MTRGIAKTRRRFVECPLKYDAHTWPRSDDRRTLRPTGRGEYGYNRVQEIVSGTDPTCEIRADSILSISIKNRGRIEKRGLQTRF
jgi:hypothetical protein